MPSWQNLCVKLMCLQCRCIGDSIAYRVPLFLYFYLFLFIYHICILSYFLLPNSFILCDWIFTYTTGYCVRPCSVFSHMESHWNIALRGHHAQITSNSTSCSTVCSGWHKIKFQSSVALTLLEENPLVTSGLPSQRDGNAESVSMSRPHQVMGSCIVFEAPDYRIHASKILLFMNSTGVWVYT